MLPDNEYSVLMHLSEDREAKRPICNSFYVCRYLSILRNEGTEKVHIASYSQGRRGPGTSGNLCVCACVCGLNETIISGLVKYFSEINITSTAELSALSF